MTNLPIANRILRRLGVSKYLNLNQSVRINGSKFIVPVRGDLGAANLAMTELWMVRLIDGLQGYFHQYPGTLIDVGVNLGQTLLKVRSVLPEIDYVGYEPNASCIHYVRELIRLNNFSDCQIIPVGVSNEPDLLELQFYYDHESDSSASMISDFRPDQQVVRTETIPVFPVESQKFSSPVTFIKIDVEGAELEVVRGLTDIIKRDRPIVSTEILPAYNDENIARIDRQNELASIFGSDDFLCYRIASNGDSSIPSLQSISHIEVHSDLEACDYLWVPAERIDAIQPLVRIGTCAA